MERSRYDELRDLYIAKLASVWMEDSTTETTRISVDKKIDSFVEGDLEHTVEIISALWEIASKDGDIKDPSSTSPAVSRSGFAFPALCGDAYSAQIRPFRPRAPPTGPT